MVITHLLGGLGNQLIKYSAGRRLAHVRSAELKLEISGVAGHDYTTFRYYELAPANVLQTFATEEDITKFMLPRYTLLPRFFRRIMRHGGIDIDNRR